MVVGGQLCGVDNDCSGAGGGRSIPETQDARAMVDFGEMGQKSAGVGFLGLHADFDQVCGVRDHRSY